MTAKILLWLEGFSPQFATAKFISEKMDCEMYAIINVNQSKKFYEEQKFLKFRKSWYFRDCFKKKFTDPDLSYLSEYEKKYNINIWKVAYSDINFNKFNKYYKFKSKEILSIFEHECRFFEKVLDEAKPDFLMIRITDSSDSQLLQLMCKARGIKVLTQAFSRLGSREIISSELDVLDTCKNNNPSKKFTFEDLQNYSKKYAKQEKTFREHYKTSELNWIKGAIEYLKMISDPKYRTYYVNYGKNIFSVIKNESLFLIKKKLHGSFLKKHAQMEINQNEKYIYFPLQLEPERTLFIPAPYYSNQFEVISNIAKSLPIDVKLLVKEHPMQVVYGWREPFYYKKILEIPNVELIHPSFSNKKLLENCEVVITISSTVGLEAAFYKKSSIILIDTIYSELPSVFKVNNFEEIPSAIEKSLKHEVKIDDLNLFINKIIDNSFEFDSESLSVLFNNEFYYGGFLFDKYVSSEAVSRFLEKFKEIFEKSADEHVLKINQFQKSMVNK